MYTVYRDGESAVMIATISHIKLLFSAYSLQIFRIIFAVTAFSVERIRVKYESTITCSSPYSLM